MKHQRALIALLLALFSVPASAQHSAEPHDRFPGAGLIFDFLGVRDSDGFSSRHARAGVLIEHESRDRFSAVGVGTDYYKQGDWSERGYSVLGGLRNVERATGAGYSVLGGLADIAGHTHLVGEFTWNTRLARAWGTEVIGSRELVETRAAIQAGTVSNFLAGSMDGTFGERFTLIGLAGAQRFSDENTRLHLRGRAIYLLAPEQGLGIEGRVRWYDSSDPGAATYFNPDSYSRAELGLRLRRSLGHWRVFAEIGAGGERVDVHYNGTAYAGFRLQRTFANKVSLLLNYALQHSSESDGTSSVQGDYRWHYLRAVLVVPF